MSKRDTMLSLVEFVELWCKLPPEKQNALEEFLNAGKDSTVEQAIDNITNETVREEFKQVLRAEGQIA